MYTIRSYTVYDILRDRKYKSIREAWPCYGPEISYSSFKYRVIHGKYPYLECEKNVISISTNEATYIGNGVHITDVETGRTWSSITDCAKDLQVSRRAVQLSLKRNRPCKGHTLELC